jgi:hypothetical protein
MVSILRSISPACGMMDSKQPMVHIRLYKEGGRYVKSARKNIIADEQPLTLGVPNFKQVLGYMSP